MIPKDPKPWKLYQKLGFRFACIFFIFFIVFLDWSVNPVLSLLYYEGPLSTLLDIGITWIGKNIFQIPDLIVSPYDGEHNDRTYVYLLYFSIGAFALVGTLVWSLIDQRRRNYEGLYYWLTVILRYYLAFTMFLFALEKFFKMQFPNLSYYTLTSRVGDMSPMHLAWAFFGYSYGYNLFIGIAEAAALLLLFRRTMTFGALITMGTLANIIAVNFSYDVHAKMYPTALFLMAFFLIIRDLKKILGFFFSGNAISLPALGAPVFQNKWMTVSKPFVKGVLIGSLILFQINEYLVYQKRADESLVAKSNVSGLYEVISMQVNADTLPIDDPLRWRQIAIGGRLGDGIRFDGDSVANVYLSAENNEIIVSGDQEVLFTRMQEVYNEEGFSESTWLKMDSMLMARHATFRFGYQKSDSSLLFLRGIVYDDSVFVTALRQPIDIGEFRLMKRRFHWINEAAYFY